MDPLHFGEEPIIPENMSCTSIEGEVREDGQAVITSSREVAYVPERPDGETATPASKRRGMRLSEAEPDDIPEDVRRDFFTDQGLVTIDASLYDEKYHEGEYIDPFEALAYKEDFDYVIPGLVRGDVGLLVSPGGAGKSSLAFYFALKVALGEGGLERGGVIMLNTEDDEKSAMIRMRDGLKTYPVDKADPGVMDTLKRNLLVWPGSGKMCDIMSHDAQNANKLQWKIYNTIREHPWHDEPRLIVIDTLRRVAPIVENSNDEMSQFVKVVEKIARLTNCAILILHHASKTTVLNGNAATQQAARGGSALVDNARFCSHVLSVTQEDAEAAGIDDKDRKNMVKYSVSKCNRGPTPPPLYFQRMKNGCLVPCKAVQLEYPAQIEYGGTAGFFWGSDRLAASAMRVQNTREGTNRRPAKRDDANIGGLIRNRPVGGNSQEQDARPETPGEGNPSVKADQMSAPEAMPAQAPEARTPDEQGASPEAKPEQATGLQDKAEPEIKTKHRPDLDLSMLALPAGTEDPAIGLILQEKSD